MGYGGLPSSRALSADARFFLLVPRPVGLVVGCDRSYEYERSLGEGNSLTANINPNENIELSWKDSGARGAWTTKVNVPWGNAKGSDVTFQRKFNL